MHLLSVNLRFNFLGHFERLEDSLSNMLKKNQLLVLLISNHTLTGATILTKVHYVTLYKECNVASFTHADMRAKFCIHGAGCLLGHLDQETAENSSTGALLAQPILYCKTTSFSPLQYYFMIYSQFFSISKILKNSRCGAVHFFWFTRV